MQDIKLPMLFLGLIFFVMQLLLTVILSMGAFYFKQLRATIDEYRGSIERRMKEGEERFRKVEDNLNILRSEVYRDYVTKPDLVRIVGTLEMRFTEVTELIEKFCSEREQKREQGARNV